MPRFLVTIRETIIHAQVVDAATDQAAIAAARILTGTVDVIECQRLRPLGVSETVACLFCWRTHDPATGCAQAAVDRATVDAREDSRLLPDEGPRLSMRD